MSETGRPSGLTALAVINFVAGGLNLMGAAGNAFALLAHRGVIPIPDEEAKERIREPIELIGDAAFALQIPWSALCGILLVIAGIGYLKLKRVLGRGFGNAYAVASILFAVAFFWLVSQHAGAGFSIGVLVALLYPVVTLVLINTTFKADMTR